MRTAKAAAAQQQQLSVAALLLCCFFVVALLFCLLVVLSLCVIVLCVWYLFVRDINRATTSTTFSIAFFDALAVAKNVNFSDRMPINFFRKFCVETGTFVVAFGW